jgi:hypothetical protein
VPLYDRVTVRIGDRVECSSRLRRPRFERALTDLGRASALLTMRRADLDQAKGTVDSFVGPLLPRLDVRLASPDALHAFSPVP